MSKNLVTKFMVATPLIAVAVLAIVLAWGHTFSSQASAVNPAMELGVSNAVACPPASTADFCALKGSTFNLTVDLTKAPAAGYIGIQTEIVYSTPPGVIIYKPTVDPADELVWPDSGFPLRSPNAPTGLEGQVNHADATSLINPPPSNFVGRILQLSINCTGANSSGNVIDLVPLDANNTDGSGVKFDALTTVATSDSITVDCVQGPTVTPVPPTNTPPANPQMQKTCTEKDGSKGDSNLCNLFMVRQGTKIPPLNCAQSTSTATFEERLSIPIPDVPEPKGEDFDGDTIVDRQELGAFEFEVHFDRDKVCVNIVPGDAADGMICIIEDKDSSQLEGVARIGCVTLGKAGPFPDTTTKEGRKLAEIVVRPQPELFNEVKPNQDNGNVVQIQNVGCELADLQGHPIAVFSCEDAELTIRYLEGDVEPDCAVNALDTQAIAFRWGVQKGSLIYVWFMNLEPWGPQSDNDIDIKDLQFVFGRFGSTCKAPWPAQLPVNPKA